MNMKLGIVALLPLIISACAHHNTLGETMLKQSSETHNLGEQWKHGHQMIAKGKKLQSEGHKLIDKGNHKVRKGEQLVESGIKMVEKSEMTYSKKYHPQSE